MPVGKHKATHNVSDIARTDSTGKPFDWRAHLKVHPAADLFPMMPPDELKALAGDIEKADGIHTPFIFDVKDRLLDGRNRLDALALLGWLTVDKGGYLTIRNETLPRFVMTRDPYDLVLSLNVHRRHLTAEQKRELIAKLLKAKPEASNVTVAKQVKADDKTVAKVRRELESTSEIPRLEKTVGADGKARKQPAKKTKPEPTATADAAPQVEPKPATNAKDIAQENFDAHVLELFRLIRGQKPRRFARTAVAQPLLGDLAHFIRELVAVRKLAAETAADDPAASAEQRKTEYAASEIAS